MTRLENIVMQLKKHKYIIALSILIAIVVYIFSSNICWLNDDLRYQYMFVEKEGCLIKDYNEYTDQIDNLDDLFSSLIVHHNYVNGRDLAHFFVHLFCGIIGQQIFAICNALVYILFILLILRISTHKYNVRSFLTVSVLVILGLATRMTPAFQINYIWMFSVVIGFLILYFSYGQRKNTAICNFWLSVYSLLAGAAHEGINIGIGCAIIIYWIMHMRSYTGTQYLMSLSFGCGLIWMCLAPGNFIRTSEVSSLSIVVNFWNFLLSVKVFYVLVICAIVAKYRYKLTWGGIYVDNAFFWNCWLVCILFNVILGVRGSRQLFGEELIAIILSIRLLRNNAFNTLWLIVFSCLVILYWCKQLVGTFIVKEQYETICTQYRSSLTGEVFISSILVPTEKVIANYYNTIPGRWSLEWSQRTFSKSMRASYAPDKQEIMVLPKYLHNKDSVDIGNKIVPCGDNMYLLVQSKKQPMKFIVNRKVSIFGKVIKDAPLVVKFNNIIKETDLWRAQLLNENEIMILGISDNKVEISK